jgi:hypothetical protein
MAVFTLIIGVESHTPMFLPVTVIAAALPPAAFDDCSCFKIAESNVTED